MKIPVELKVKPLKDGKWVILLYRYGILIKEKNFDNKKDIPKYTKEILEGI